MLGRERECSVDFSAKIGPENVKVLGEMLALCAFKPFLRYAHAALGRLYAGLIDDINAQNRIGQRSRTGTTLHKTRYAFCAGIWVKR
jgi:hypothetical protein